MRRKPLFTWLLPVSFLFFGYGGGPGVDAGQVVAESVRVSRYEAIRIDYNRAGSSQR